VRNVLGLAVAVVATASVLLALSARPALANHVQCGDVITQDTTLDSDLVDCPRFGIVIGADQITLDLNGHTIAGSPRVEYPGYQYLTAEAGVVNGVYGADLPAHDGVVIKNGVIREFVHGVLLSQSRDPNNSASHNALYDLTTFENANGIALGSMADHNLVTRNQAFDNGPTNEGAGIRLESVGLGNRIRRNVTSGNYWGIFLEGGADGTQIERNLAAQNLYGIYLTDQRGATHIRGNEVSRNSVVGISMSESVNARIEENLVVGNGNGGGIVAGSADLDPPGGATLIAGNRASRNDADGIYAYGRLTTVERNVGNDNADLGIDAVGGVIDGGGNRAFGNGNPLQCLNVSCKTTGKPRN
jgi:parallel beta-helix repeat protein